MALPGPAPKANKIGRTPTADWTLVDDAPFLAGEERELPDEHRVIVSSKDGSDVQDIGWSLQTVRWWEIVRVLPHAILWGESEWLFATDTAVLKDKFYNGTATSAEAVEMRRREDIMGVTADARHKLRIRYVEPREVITSSDGEVVREITTAPRSRRRAALLDG